MNTLNYCGKIEVYSLVLKGPTNINSLTVRNSKYYVYYILYESIQKNPFGKKILTFDVCHLFFLLQRVLTLLVGRNGILIFNFLCLFNCWYQLSYSFLHVHYIMFFFNF